MKKLARERALELARVAKKHIRGKSLENARRWAIGYWLVAVDHDKALADYRQLFLDAVLEARKP